MSGILTVRGLSQSYDKKTSCLTNVSFDLAPGEILAVLGSSGCGKSTLLNVIAGFLEPSEGEVFLRGQLVASPEKWVKPAQRKIGYLFQEASLFPHMTVEENIRFGLRHQKKKANDLLARLVEQLSLTELLRRYPHEVSGGQKQRVALVRALVLQPDLILMDEPFSSLDENFVNEFLPELKGWLKQMGVACLYVTHRISDLWALADRILVVKQGRVLQQGSFQDLYLQPNCLSVAKFLGPGDLFSCERKGQEWVCDLGPVKIEGVPDGANTTHIFIRPSEIVRDEQGELEFLVSQTIFDGESTHVRAQREGREFRFTLSGACECPSGSTLKAKIHRTSPFSAVHVDA